MFGDWQVLACWLPKLNTPGHTQYTRRNVIVVVVVVAIALLYKSAWSSQPMKQFADESQCCDIQNLMSQS